MSTIFKNGDVVLQKYFPEAPAMYVVNISDDLYTCRYKATDSYQLGVFYNHELIPGFDEVINQEVCLDDYVRHRFLANSPVMVIVDDFNNEFTFGCRYIVDGVLHYGVFKQNELVRLTDEELEVYENFSIVHPIGKNQVK